MVSTSLLFLILTYKKHADIIDPINPIGAARTLLRFRCCFDDDIILVTVVVEPSLASFWDLVLTVRPSSPHTHIHTSTHTRFFLFETNALVLFYGLTFVNFYFCMSFLRVINVEMTFLHKYNLLSLRSRCLIVETRNAYICRYLEGMCGELFDPINCAQDWSSF